MSSVYKSSDMEVSPTGTPRPGSLMYFTMPLIMADIIVGDQL